MATTMELQRSWRGPVLFSYGFRPFFSFGAVLAALLILLWVPWFLGLIAIPSALPPVAWHTHELLFGYVPAIVAGFLLTAVPNWTGRLPVVGRPLIGLFGLWLVGRLSVVLSSFVDPLSLAALTLFFPVALAGVIAREIVAGRNWRNLKVLTGVVVLGLAQALFHHEIWRYGRPLVSDRIAIGATLMLIMIVGGRIVPSFTTNWLKRENPGRQPVPFGRFDLIAMMVAALALAGWAAAPLHPAIEQPTGLLLLASGILQVVRLIRWAGDRTLAEPLITVLHVAFAFVPVGFWLSGYALLMADDGARSAGLHAWTAGATGLMTLAVMTRASRGHSGRPLTAPPATVLIYVAAFLAAVLRMAAAFAPAHTMMLLGAAGGAWVVAFLGFAACYGPMLLRSREGA
ncbi:MAG: NnrS family protein [Phreatobacter sp.]|uniref:NnrS family protein n=1 Tax=Phreatobacter sp. TaxID=1966341 RepID=UPI001A5CB5C6|nr:NnrS family protein [Phreatobacter sp.]MBL8570231.1 NnrS family protein [Phreatobacter sp.]